MNVGSIKSNRIRASHPARMVGPKRGAVTPLPRVSRKSGALPFFAGARDTPPAALGLFTYSRRTSSGIQAPLRRP